MTVSFRRILVALLFAAALCTPAGAQQGPAPVDSATAATVRRLLELTGAANLAVRSMEAMLPAQRAAMPQIPAAFWDAFMAHARRDISQLVEALVSIYAAHFTRAELEELVRFYESPIGRRLADVQPLITQESMQAGQQWGAAIGREVGDSLSRAGVKP